MVSTNPYEAPQSDLAAGTAGDVDGSGPFDPKGRFSRLSYIAWAMLASIAVNLVQFVLSLILVGAGAISSSDAAMAAGGAGLVVTLIFSVALLVVTVIFFIRRLHDMDMNGWWALLILVPLVNVIFGLFAIIKAGTPGPNRFGPPRITRGWEQVLGIIGIALMVLSIAVVLLLLVLFAAGVVSTDMMQSLS